MIFEHRDDAVRGQPVLGAIALDATVGPATIEPAARADPERALSIYFKRRHEVVFTALVGPADIHRLRHPLAALLFETIETATRPAPDDPGLILYQHVDVLSFLALAQAINNEPRPRRRCSLVARLTSFRTGGCG